MTAGATAFALPPVRAIAQGSEAVPGRVMNTLSTYMSAARSRALPEDVIEQAKYHLLDSLAAMISGSELPPGQAAQRYVREHAGSGGTITVVGSALTAPPIDAALANGVMTHADETDDSHNESRSHPGCAVVPAALAIAERTHASGERFLRAVVLGYDVCARVNYSLGADAFAAASRSTHSFGGVFGAGAAAGALLGLDALQVRHLLSYCAQQASGVGCNVRDGEHVEKAFDFGGMPARNGVAAAAMVAHGFTGVDDVFAGERNFFVAYDESRRTGKPPEPERLIEDLGTRFEIVNTNIKRWSVGSPIQAPLDALVDLIRTHNIKGDDVQKLVVRVAHQGANTVNDRDMPDICMQHMCAVMLLDGIVTFESAHDEKRMKDKKVLEVRSRVELYGDDDLTRAMPSRQGIVELTLRDRRELRQHVKAVRGTSDNPMTRAEVDEKCFHLLSPILGRKRARLLCDTVWTLEEVSSMRDLRALLRG
jgi:2-methylcitrate dehydratase PrpD